MCGSDFQDTSFRRGSLSARFRPRRDNQTLRIAFYTDGQQQRSIVQQIFMY